MGIQPDHQLASVIRAVAAEYGVPAKPIPNNSRVHGKVVHIAPGEGGRENALIVNDQAIHVVSFAPGQHAKVGQVMALDKTGTHVRMTAVRIGMEMNR